MALTSDEINFLIYRYLRESGFEHSAYAFGHESFIYKSSLESSLIPPGALISFVQKGLQYAEIESHINEDGTETICEEAFTLMKKHTCKPRAAKRKIFNAFDSLDSDYGQLEIDEARMLRTPLDTTKGDHLGTSGLKNMSVCVLWHPYVPSEKNSKRGNPLAEQQQNTILTAMADGEIKIWEWREEEDEDESKDEQMNDINATTSSASPTPKQPFQKGFVCVRTISPPSSSSASSSSSAIVEPLAITSQAQSTTDASATVASVAQVKAEDEPMTDVTPAASTETQTATQPITDASQAPTESASQAQQEESNKRQKLSDGSALPLLNGVPATPAAATETKPAECHVNSNQSIVAIDWHPRGISFAAASYSGLAHIWSAKGQLLHSLDRHTAPITTLKYNKSGSLLLTASVDHTICLWDVETGACKKQWHLHSGPVLDLDWAPVFVANTSGKNRDSAATQSTDPDNQYLFASCSTDGQIFVVDIREVDEPASTAAGGASSATPTKSREPRLFQGHEGEVNSISWDPTGTLLLSCSDDCTVKIWNASNGDILHDLIDHEKEVLTARWSGTGPCTEFYKYPLFIATGSTDTTVKLFDPNSGHCLHTLTQHTHPVSQLAFAPRQQLLATASHERVFIWSLNTGTLLKTFKNLGDPLIQTPNHIPLGMVGGLNDLAFDSKGEQLAVSYADGMTYVLDLANK